MFINVFKLSARSFNFTRGINSEKNLIQQINVNFIRSYKKFRHATRIVNEDELFDPDEEETTATTAHSVPKIEKTRSTRSKPKKKDANPLRTDLDDDNNVKKVTDWGSLPVFSKLYDNEEAIS